MGRARRFMNWRTTAIIAISVAVTVIVILLLRGCDKPSTPPEDTELWREKVEMREAVIKTKDSIIASLQAIRATQREAYQKDSSRLVRENARLSRGYEMAKDEVEQITDSTGRIAAYVSVTDSILQAKDSLYRQEVGHRLALEKLHNVEVAAMAARHVQVVELNQEYVARVASLENKNARLEKRLRNPVSFGINAGPGVVYTPDGKFHGGLGANIGVSFKIRLR